MKLSNKKYFETLARTSNAIISQVKAIAELDLMSVNYKTDNDAVTNKDIALQSIVKSELAILDPLAPILSEEDDFSDLCGDDGWMIDPLDGTSNYIQGLKYQAISIAKLESGKITCAIVIDLENYDVYSAILGGGAKINGVAILACEPKIKLVGMSTGVIKLMQSKREIVIPEGINIRVLGSQALQLCFVATGRLVANISLEAKAWDDVAGALIVREAGGSYSCEAYPNKGWFDLAKKGVNLKSAAVSSHTEEKIKMFVDEVFNV